MNDDIGRQYNWSPNIMERNGKKFVPLCTSDQMVLGRKLNKAKEPDNKMKWMNEVKEDEEGGEVKKKRVEEKRMIENYFDVVASST